MDRFGLSKDATLAFSIEGELLRSKALKSLSAFTGIFWFTGLGFMNL